MFDQLGKYLVIWQLGTNKRSRHETPINILLYADDTAEKRYENIKKELYIKEGVGYRNDNVQIIGIFKL